MERITELNDPLASQSIKMEETTRPSSSRQNKTKPCARLGRLTTCGLSLALVLTVTLSQHIRPAGADAALSEVWSEAGGLQVKYSTNHDDLLNTKGSEISLRSDQRHASPTASDSSDETQATTGSTAGQEAETTSSQANSSEDSPSNEDSASSQENDSSQDDGEQAAGSGDAAANNEQGAADSRKNEKTILPSLAGRVQSYSSVSIPKHSTSASASSSSPLLLAGRNHKSPQAADYRGPGDVSEEPARTSAKSFGRAQMDSAPTFESLDATFEGSDDGKNNNETPAASEEQTSADPNDDSPAQSRDGPPAGLSKFSQPGRLFKEAVRMTGSDSKRNLASANNNDDDDNDGGSSSSSSVANSGESADELGKSKSKAAADQNDDNADDESDSGDGSWNVPIDKQSAAAKRAHHDEQNTIDYERPYGTTVRDAQTAADNDAIVQDNSEQPQLFRQMSVSSRPQGGQFAAGQDDNYDNDDEDSSSPLDDSRRRANGVGARQLDAISNGGPMFHDNAGRPLLAASSQKGQTQALSVKPTATIMPPTSLQQANKQSIKQLAYFKGQKANDQLQAVNGGPSREPIMRLNGATNEERAPEGSPDSVRDDFISPGHYPGSMPHLTQAASEIAQSATASARKATAPSVAKSGAETVLAVAATTTTVQANKLPAIANANNQGASVGETIGNGEQKTEASSQNANSALVHGGQSDTDSNRRESSQATSDTKGAEQKLVESGQLMSIAVTPMPELQLESQQIMAPILVSTTTMAPMPLVSSTTSPSPQPASSTLVDGPSATTAASSTTTSTTSTTTKAPSLKRFKFRKYR
jgi:hypothetical protein